MDLIEAIFIVISIVVLIHLSDVIAERYCLRKLKKAQAFSSEKSVTPEEAKIDPGPLTAGALVRLVRHKKVKMTGDGRYYLDYRDSLRC